MVATVKLFPKELKWCQQHAENIVNHYGGEGSKGSGAYNHNKIITAIYIKILIAVYYIKKLKFIYKFYVQIKYVWNQF